ncbi:MAG TPA: hypothetical protein VFN74_15525 [Chloroflexota bacterium]|nr:hypothetical protein [Chloroflexota bacterium]
MADEERMKVAVFRSRRCYRCLEMDAKTDTRPAWVRELLEDVARPVSEEEIARRKRAAERARELRDRIGSIAPDTTGEYIRAIREGEADRA